MSLFLDRPDDLDAVWTWAIRQPGLDWDAVRTSLRAGLPAHWIRRMDGGPRVGLVAASGDGRAAVYLHPAAFDVAEEIPSLLAAAGFVGGALTDFVPALVDALDGRVDRRHDQQWWTIVPARSLGPRAALETAPDERSWFADAYAACYGTDTAGAARVWDEWSRDPQFPHRRVYFLVEDGSPVAFCAGTRERAGEELVRWIGTRPDRQRQGIGTRVLRSAVARAVADGCFSASIVVPAGSPAARALVRAAGFHRLWRRLAWGRA